LNATFVDASPVSALPSSTDDSEHETLESDGEVTSADWVDEEAGTNEVARFQSEGYRVDLTQWVWRWGTALALLWEVGFRAFAMWIGTPREHSTSFAVLVTISDLPVIVASMWLQIAIAGGSPHRAWWGVLAICLGILVSLVCFGGASAAALGATAGYIVGVVAAGGKRKGLSFALLLWMTLFQTFAVAYLHSLGCKRRTLSGEALAAMQILMRVSECAARALWSFVWQRCRGEAPSSIFVLLIVLTTAGAEITQLANFMAAAHSEEPWNAMAKLLLASVATDFVSRSRLLHVVKDAIFEHRVHRLCHASDVALRARWANSYVMMLPFSMMTACWAQRGIDVWIVASVFLGYFASETISSCLLFSWQHMMRRSQFGASSVLETYKNLKEPFGHAFPRIFGATFVQQEDSSPAAKPSEEDLPGFGRIQSDDMAGIFLIGWMLILMHQGLLSYVLPESQLACNVVLVSQLGV